MIINYRLNKIKEEIEINKKNKLAIILIASIVAITVIIGVVFAFVINSNSSEVKVNKNVTIINKKEAESMPIEVTENQLVFSTPQNYSEGDVIVSGITDTAPNGFLRKVVKTETVDNKYIVETTNACLTDVFEEAHISRTFEISEDSITPVDSLKTENAKIGLMLPKKSLSNNLEIGTIIPNKDSGADLITLGIERELTKNISVTGSIGYRPFLEPHFDIENNNIEFGIALRNTVEGNLLLKSGNEKEFEESIKLLNKNLKAIEFMAGEVPIVITNALNITLDGSGYIGGSLSTGLTLNCESTSGFKYSSATNTVEEIKENKYLGDGIEWETTATAFAGVEVGVFFHIISKLYDIAGADLSVGVTGKAECELTASPNQQFNNMYYAGNIDLSVQPKLKGNIVVEEPIIDYTLIDQPLFEFELNPFWEKNWSSSGNWKQDIWKANPVTIDKSSKLYEMYFGILKDVYNEYVIRDSVGFRMYYYNSKNNIHQRGGPGGVAYFNGATPVYYLRDINDDDIPELFIGKKFNNNYEILAIYSYGDDIEPEHPYGDFITGQGEYYDVEDKYINYVYLCGNNEILIRHEENVGGELITYSYGNSYNRRNFENADKKFIVNTNNLDWKEFTEYSSDIKSDYKKELAYSKNGLEIYVAHKMGEFGPEIHIVGTNNTNNKYYCYLTEILYKDKYCDLSSLEEINKDNFSISPHTSYRTEESLNQKGYCFTIAVNSKETDKEVFRKTFTEK